MIANLHTQNIKMLPFVRQVQCELVSHLVAPLFLGGHLPVWNCSEIVEQYQPGLTKAFFSTAAGEGKNLLSENQSAFFLAGLWP